MASCVCTIISNCNFFLPITWYLHIGAVLISHPAEIDLKTPFLIHQLTVVTIVTFSSLLLFVLKIRAVDKVPPQTAWLNERHKVRVILLFLCNNNTTEIDFCLEFSNLILHWESS